MDADSNNPPIDVEHACQLPPTPVTDNDQVEEPNQSDNKLVNLTVEEPNQTDNGQVDSIVKEPKQPGNEQVEETKQPKPSAFAPNEDGDQVDIIVEEHKQPEPEPNEEHTVQRKIDYFRSAAKLYRVFDFRNTGWVPTIPLRCRQNTVLHIAVGEDPGIPFNRKRKHRDYVEYLAEHMTSEDLEIRNADGDTAFCVAATRGNVEIAEILLKKNRRLASISGHAGMSPIELAASRGHRAMVEFIYENNKEGVQNLPLDSKVQLLTLLMTNGLHDVAKKLMDSNTKLGSAPNREGFTAYQLCGRVCQRYSDIPSALLDHSAGEEMRPHQLSALFEAVKSGNREFCNIFLFYNPDLIMELDSMKQTILHIAILHRQESVFLEILESTSFFDDHLCKDQLIQVVDNIGNNILHMAAIMPPEETFGSSRPNIRMHSEEQWFKEVRKRVPPAFKTMKNKDGLTPKELFHREHKKLSEEGEFAAKGIAQSGMLVATLIATIVFAAALTVPGKDTPSGPQSYVTIFQKETWFSIFILSNAVSLFSSSSSIMFYLSILSSSFAEDEFISSLQRRLMFGLMALFFSIVTMVVAFIAASFLIFEHLSTWVAYVVASLSCIPVILFLVLHTKLWRDLLPSFYKFRIRLSKAIEGIVVVIIGLLVVPPVLLFERVRDMIWKIR